MNIFKTLVFFADHDHGHPYLIDTVSIDNEWWLVGSWLKSNSSGRLTPDVIVLLSNLPHQDIDDQQYRFVLNSPIPKVVLDGQVHADYKVRRYATIENLEGPDSVH